MAAVDVGAAEDGVAAGTGRDGELDAGVAEGEGGEGFGEEGADGVLEEGAGSRGWNQR